VATPNSVPPASACAETGLPYSEVTGEICRVPSTSFSQAPWYTLPVHLCRFRVRSCRWSYFLEDPGYPLNPITANRFRPSSLPAGGGILTPFPSATAFALALGARLTLRGLTLRRNPWTYGDRVSHSVCRYSCQHSHFRYLQHTLRCTFTGIRNAPLPRVEDTSSTHPQLRYVALAPIHFRRRLA